jgi:hypothetical protein
MRETVAIPGLLDVILQRGIPRLLRFYNFVPVTVVFIVLTGSAFSLPPGPLCDEGMILFMEGGCDWGDSNLFFFSKLGALVAVNVAFVVSSRRSPTRPGAFLPHLLLLCWLGWMLRSGGGCDTYYSHPNGSGGQMALEIAAFAVLGLALVPLVRYRRARTVTAALVGWNWIHVGLFYIWLEVADHWTWEHTWLLCGSMLVLGALAMTANNLRRRGIGAATQLPLSAGSVGRH